MATTLHTKSGAHNLTVAHNTLGDIGIHLEIGFLLSFQGKPVILVVGVRFTYTYEFVLYLYTSVYLCLYLI